MDNFDYGNFAGNSRREGVSIMNGSTLTHYKGRNKSVPMCAKCVMPEPEIKIGQSYMTRPHGRSKTKYYHEQCWERLLQ